MLRLVGLFMLLECLVGLWVLVCFGFVVDLVICFVFGLVGCVFWCVGLCRFVLFV